jgi:hypothetical protein
MLFQDQLQRVKDHCFIFNNEDVYGPINHENLNPAHAQACEQRSV